MNRSRQDAGFSVIEALAAIAIIAIALAPLLDLQRQIIQIRARQDEALMEASATESAVSMLHDINAAAAPAGVRPIDDGLSLRWRARPISEEVRSTRRGQGDGQFMVGLYRLDVEVVRRDGSVLNAFSMESLGWRQISAPDGMARQPEPGPPME